MTDNTLILIDSHAHLSSRAFRDDAEAALQRARAAGVALVIDVGTEPEDWAASLALAGGDDSVRCVLGLHPNSASLWTDEVADRLAALIASPTVVGVGETGLDYYRLGAPAEQQKAAFINHLALARGTGLPVVIHARDAYEDILDILERDGGGTTGVMHSFAGGREQARRAVSLGYYISISGPVTYRSGRNIREVAGEVSLDRLLVETDSPYLPPQPHRGRRNEPAHVALTAAAVAEARGISVAELATATTENACRLFGLTLPQDRTRT